MAVFAAFGLLIVGFVRGAAWLVENLLGWVVLVGWLVLGIDIVILLPMAIFRRLRITSGSLLLISSYVFGLATWLYGFAFTYALWGGFAVVMGLFMFGVGVVPMALLATAFRGMWDAFGTMLALVVLTFGSRLVAAAISATAERSRARGPIAKNIASPARRADSEITEMFINEEEPESDRRETAEEKLARLEAENAKLRQEMLMREKTESKPSFPVGGYSLNMILKDGPPLREFSPADYKALGAIEYVGQKIFHAPTVEFVGRPWNLSLGAVQSRLYKIALSLQLGDKNEADEAAFGALTFCNERLGKPAEQHTGLFLWKTTDGNVVLQTAEARDGFAVNLFLTASSVREFRRVGQ